MLLATRLAHALIIVVFCFATLGCGESTEPTSTEGAPEISSERTAPGAEGGEDGGEGGSGGAIPEMPPE